MMALVDRALALNPNFARGWHISGMLRRLAGQPDIAIEHVEAALRLSPRARIGSSLVSSASRISSSRRFDEAVPKLLLAIQEDPSFPALSLSRRLLCPYGAARRSARGRRAAAGHHLCRDTEPAAVRESRAPRAFPVGPAPGGGRGGMSQTRRLAAILAADVAGYSRLMGADEEGTLERLKAHAPRADRSEDRRASRPDRQDHRRRPAGRVCQRRRCGALRGRGAARRWPSANAEVPADSRIEFRIGINLGDVIVEERRHLWRRRQRRGAARSAWPSPAGSASPGRCATRSATSSTFAFEDMGEQQRQEHRPAGAGLPGRDRRRAGRGIRRRRHRSLRAARQAVDRGAAVPEHERRPGAGIFRRRHGRGDHHRALPHPLAVRHRPQFELHLQRPSRRREAGRPRAWRALRARRLGAQRRAVGCASPRS